MSILNEFVCPNARFKFWNGKKEYTVQCCPSLRMWWVFDEDKESDALAKYEHRESAVNIETAAHYLDKYFQSINSENFVTY